LVKLELSGNTFEKYSNTKFYENLTSGSRVVPYGRTDIQTDMKKLVVVFRNFENAPSECVYDRERWREEKLMPTLLATRHSIPEFAIN
jgi:hypothetical protein